MNTTSQFTRAAVAAGSLSALIFTVGCGGLRQAGAPGTTSAATTTATGLPIVVSCAPTQRTVVRPTVVNGVAMSEVECVAGDAQQGQPIASAQPFYQAAPPAQTLVTPVSYRSPRARPLEADNVEDAEIVPVSSRASSGRPVRARQVVYEPVRAKRSVKKSAVIIASSAGAGAGLGAAIGGKKGALIGAAVAGGGATLWDQVTRRKD